MMQHFEQTKTSGPDCHAPARTTVNLNAQPQTVTKTLRLTSMFECAPVLLHCTWSGALRAAGQAGRFKHL